jgi:hypothetical protein
MDGANAYTVTFEEGPTYLHAKLVGTRSPQNLIRFLEQVHATCVERDRSDVLLEMHLEGPSLDMGAIFSVITQRSPAGATLRKIAYLETAPLDPVKARFAETVAINRGVNVRLFDQPEAARQWLAEP